VNNNVERNVSCRYPPGKTHLIDYHVWTHHEETEPENIERRIEEILADNFENVILIFCRDLINIVYRQFSMLSFRMIYFQLRIMILSILCDQICLVLVWDLSYCKVHVLTWKLKYFRNENEMKFENVENSISKLLLFTNNSLTYFML
jgi:hypothetical protein